LFVKVTIICGGGVKAFNNAVNYPYTFLYEIWSPDGVASLLKDKC